jgi:DNA invertase Pin-like site-specific DNA recombinase
LSVDAKRGANSQEVAAVMRVVGYVRVSSRNKRHQEESAPEQERAIRAWCKQHGHRLVGIYPDVGVSGADNLEDREQLPLAEAAIREGKADGLVVKELDRLHRDLIVQEHIFADLWRIRPEVEVFSTLPSQEQNCRRDDPDDPTRRFIRHILGATADYIRAQTVARMRAGKRRKREQGGYVGGQPAYGQRSVDKELADDPAEQAAIARIAELHRGGASLRQIAATLDREGHRPKRSDRWHPMKVKLVVDRL